MFRRFVLTLSLVAFAGVAHADIFDRIDSCERAGGGSCVFNLLRELASDVGSGPVIPQRGAYRQTETSALCADQYLEPVLGGGQVTAVRVGWCGAQFNQELACTGKLCVWDTNVTVEILSSTSYRFTNERGATAVFRRAN